MRNFVVACLAALSLLSVTGQARAQRVHEIRLEANTEKEAFRFVPAQVNARPGDLLVFKTVTGSPHSIVWEAGKLSAAAHESLNGSMTRRTGDLSSPLLSPDGAEYRMVVPDLGPGRYEFYCLPHRAYDMRGALNVTK